MASPTNSWLERRSINKMCRIGVLHTSPHPVVGVRVLSLVSCRRMCKHGRRTVSTQHSMSRMNLDDAPNARMTGTPAITSPYMEYRGDLVTESAHPISTGLYAKAEVNAPKRRISLEIWP